MFDLKIVTDFVSAHSLRNYPGDCASLHSHNWKMDLSICSKVLNDNGFKAPKRNLPTLLARILGRFDKQLSFFLKDINILRVYHSNNARDILGWKFRTSESAIVDAAKQINKLL